MGQILTIFLPKSKCYACYSCRIMYHSKYKTCLICDKCPVCENGPNMFRKPFKKLSDEEKNIVIENEYKKRGGVLE